MHVAGGHQRPEPLLVDVALAHEAGAVEPEPLQPPVEVEARARWHRRAGAGPRLRPAHAREGLEQLRHALARVDVAEGAEERVARRPPAVRRRARGRPDAGRPRPAGVAGRARPVADVVANGRSGPSRGRAPRRRAGSPRAGSPRAAGCACRGRRGRAAARRRRPRAPSRRGSRGRRGGRSSARRRGGGGRSRGARRDPGVRRNASTIQPCASGLLPMW